MARISRLRFSLGTLVFLTLLSGILLTNSYTHALDDEDAISCTLSYSVDSEHTVTATNNSYTTDIGTTTFSAVCNDNAGFAIYTVGYSNNEYGNNKMLANVNNTLDPTYDIDTGTATSGDTSNWAMKLSAVSGDYTPTIENNFNNYSSIPNEYTKAVSFPSTTDDTVGSKLRSTYAIYLSTTQPAGTYTGEVKYTLVHPQTETPCMEGKICYHKNANNVVGSMGRQNVTGATAMLMASNFSHNGYGFAGWNTEEDGTGTSYGPNETITLPSDMSEGLNLYAMWVKSTGSLQDWGGCYEMSIGDVTALTDQRDNDTYAIARLADGNCWMIENLRLDNDATTGSANEALAQGYGTSTTYGNFSGLANPEAPWIGDSTTANSLYSIDGSDNTINIGVDDNPSRRFPRYNNQNTASRDNYPTTNQNIYSYGNYYTWAAAIADLKPNDTNNKITTGTSLCPTGWRLPSGGAAYASGSTTGVNVTGDTATYRDFYNLGYKIMDEIRTAYEDTVGSEGAYYSDNTTNLAGDTATKAFRKYPNNFVLSGYVYNGSISNRNSYGLYWSSSARNTDYAYRLYMNNSVVYPSTAGGNKYYGRSVRCITASTARQNVTINFDERVESVILHSDEFGTKTVTRSGSVVELPENTTYTISGTYDTDYDFESWSTTANGTLGSTSSAETTYAVSGAATLTLYSKKVCSQGNICYDKNNRDANAPGGDMGNQTVSGTSAILWASNYGREGYGFAGWNTAADGTGTSYGPNETITFDPTDEDGLMLYAMWVAPRGTLQKFTCAKTMPVGTIIGLLDERDDQVYAVAKLSDGKCWMIENMRVENTATIGANNEALSQGYGGIFDGLAAAELDNFADVTTGNTMYATRDITGNNVSSRIPRYRNDNRNNTVMKMTDINQRIYSYGNYYNFPAAIANTTDFTTQGETTTTSICPAGWRIPSGGSKNYKDSSDYWALIVDALNEGITPTSSGGNIYDGDAIATNLSNTIREYPNNFLNSGFAEDGSAVHGKGGRGDYWSSTIADNNEAFRFSFRFNGVNPGTSPLYKYDGFAVRCVTGTVTKQTVTVNFDEGVSAVSLQSDRFGKYTVTTSGSTVRLADGVDYTISATYNEGKDFESWTTTANGTLGSTSSAETTYAVSGTATLTLYSKKVCSQGYICYDKNNRNANAPGGDMGNQAVSDTSAILWASNYGREGYGFAGWNTAADGTGTNYGPNETITFDPNDPDGLMLYAMWVESEGDLQDFVCPDNTQMPIGTVTGLTDTRDGQTYAVAKLADGNCWMVENLRLGRTDGDNNTVILSASNTNNPLLPLTNNDGNTSNSLSVSQDPAVSAWCSDNDAICDDKSMVFTGNTTNPVANMTDGDQNIYTYGNYYNWYSATAGHGKYSTTSYATTDGDICPSNWFLPYGNDGTGNKGGNTNGGYYYLGVKLNAIDSSTASSEIWRSYPNNFILSGNADASSITSRFHGGMYWTATTLGNNTAHSFSFGSDVLNPGTGNNRKNIGRAVRCVIKAIPSKSVTVNFDDGVDKVVLQNSRYGDITVDTSGTTVQIKENIEYTISATYKTEKDFDGWTTTANGTLGSASSAETTYKVSGTATLSLVTKKVCIQGRICYDNNHNDTNASGGSMGKQSVSGGTTTLWASNFKREGYGFAGWNTEADGTGTNYGPNETIQTPDFTTTNPKGLRLYAKWVAPAQDANSTELTFQTANLLTTTLKDGTTLASKPNGYVTALKDQRDGDVYAVAKLADGNYWMIENLRLADKDSDNNDIVLSSSNTHNPSLPLTNTDSTTSNHLSATTNPTQNPWCTGSSSDCIDKSMLATNNTTLFTNNTASGYSAGGNVYSYGNYYNWYSATAGHGKFGSNYGSSFVAPGDICPAGWHLPTGRGATGDFGVLDIALGGTGGYSGPNTTPAGATISLAYRSYPNNFVYTGYVYGSGIGSSRNIDGGYWSASGNWNDTSNYFSFSNSSVYPGTTTSVKFVGHMVRCIYGV